MKPRKELILLECEAVISAQIERAKQAMAFAQASANEETKSSAGDKYETGRALAQLERDKAARQLAEAMKLKKVLDHMKPRQHDGSVDFGSVVVTDKGYFFIAAGLGQIEVEQHKLFVLSQMSPLGRRLVGNVAGETVEFNDTAYKILEVY